ncbi:MAG: coproporphyrinogen III oxidase [Oscillatoriophycideae cyanobacterium NC_groundwater_1537_Pr4_S-0.65um_50_18]|nr:coproporphyrinogen III oxidase [Oscillatoriophycideae cyanobacterium NC_groundwater_1537_Pr4_S-0.65um_50_18]
MPDQVSTATLADRPTAAYVHIPFCRRRCYYCDFPISVVGDRPPQWQQGQLQFGTIADYVEILCREIRATPRYSAASLDTVFLGGGTPSLLTSEQLDQILKAIDCCFGIASDAEISMEIDPNTFDLDRLRGYRAAGINRVSLGVQAFQTELLQACGRTHTAADVYAAIEMIHQVNLTNFSLDLISGLPHLTAADWQDSLEKAIALAPSHLSVYDLTIEPGTAFARRYQPGESPLPTDDMTAQMYRAARQTLTQAGYEHYEISNYAKPGYQCRHNRVYWENRSYYGFGMAAASYVQQQRFTRPRQRQAYAAWVQDYENAGGTIACPVTDQAERLLDTLMLGLRLSEGLSLSKLETDFGGRSLQQVLTCLEPFQRQGWVALTGAPDSRLRLTDPQGFLFSNVVLSQLFKELGEG